jgi:hypothetical protein
MVLCRSGANRIKKNVTLKLDHKLLSRCRLAALEEDKLLS